MSSDLTSQHDMPRHVSGYLSKMLARTEEIRRWAEAHPDLAVAWDAALEEDADRRARAEAERWRAMLVASIPCRLPEMGAPRRLAEAVQGELLAPEARRRFWDTKAMHAARLFLAERKAILLMFGGAGAGKTAAATWVLTHATSRLYEPWEVSLDPAKGLFVRAAAAARIPRFDDHGEWARMLRVPWLVLDDLGIETLTDYWAERVNELVDARYGDRRRTVLTSNLTAEAFKARYGERIVSRLRDDAIIVDVGSDDLRGRTA
jgi:hypothetical protein